MPASEGLIPDWPRAHGEPLFRGQIKQSTEDFEVTEELGFTPSGDGEHDFLWVEKLGENTARVAGVLARHAGVAARDVGYAGLKDRQAITRQWFSVRRPSAAGSDWASFDSDGVRILDVSRNRRKLRRGVHAGNRFRLVVRSVDVDESLLDHRLGRVVQDGVPNYFGPQRFGHGGNNLRLALDFFAGRRLRRDQRGHALSAARSLIFNDVLAARVTGGNWNRACPDDVFNHDASNSLFLAAADDGTLEARLQSLDAHPTGPLWGLPGRDATQAPTSDEEAIAALRPDYAEGLLAKGAHFDRRALRLAVRDLDWSVRDGILEIAFSLRTGGFATTVLRELMDVA
jgi:tRNA pseudouridine13 synthase